MIYHVQAKTCTKTTTSNEVSQPSNCALLSSSSFSFIPKLLQTDKTSKQKLNNKIKKIQNYIMSFCNVNSDQSSNDFGSRRCTHHSLKTFNHIQARTQLFRLGGGGGGGAL